MSSSLDSGISTLIAPTSLPVARSITPQGKPDFENLQEKYLCTICGEVLRNSMQLPCGHQLCETPCVEDLFQNNTTVTCPRKEEEECRTPFGKNEVFKDMCTRKEILMLKVFCDYKNAGCKEKMPWRSLEKHIQVCDYRPVLCPNDGCDESVIAKKLENHKSKNCKFRPVQCSFCNEMVPFSALKNHEDEICTKVLVSCPNQCGQSSLPRDEMQIHKKKCPKAPRKCSYWTIGCEVEGLDQEVSHHEKTDTDHHLKKVVEFTNKTGHQNQTLAEEIKVLKEEKSDLEKSVTQMSIENKKMKEEVEKVTKEFVKELKRKMVAMTERIIHLERSIQNLPKKEIVERQERELSALKEEHSSVVERVSRLERSGSSGVSGAAGGKEASGATADKLKQTEKQLAIVDIRLAELDLRFQVLETASYDGVLMWKIKDYPRRKQDAAMGRTVSLYSQPFYTSRYGYKMCARVYLNGDGMGRGTHLSLFFVVMKGEYDALLSWPFQHKVTLMVLDQQDRRRNVSDSFQPDPTSSSFTKPTTEMNIATGCPLFMSHSVLESGTYLKEDSIFIKVIVEPPGNSTRLVT